MPSWSAQAADGPAPPCQPAARLEGHQSLVAPIGRVLRARGVAPNAQPAPCRQVAVEVKSSGAGYHLVIEDPEGRTSRRHLASAASAALVIESWSRGDLAAPLPAPAQAEPVTDATPAPDREAEGETTAPPRGDLEARAAPAPVDRPLTPSLLGITVAGESAFAVNRSSWWGGRAGLCLRTGPLCTGLAGRYARAIAAATTTLVAPLAHHEFDLSLTSELPLSLGPLRVLPALGLGVGRSVATFAGALLETNAPVSTISPRRPFGTRDRGRDGNHRDRRDGDEPASSTTFRDAVRTERQDHLLGQAGLTVSLPLTPVLAVDLGLSVGMTLSRWGDKTGLPRERLRGGLGLRYGGL